MSHECSAPQGHGESVESSQPLLCVNGCGFFGNQANMGMCSKCYREKVSEEERIRAGEKAAVAALSTPVDTAALSQPFASGVLGSSSPKATAPAVPSLVEPMQLDAPSTESVPAASTPAADSTPAPSLPQPTVPQHESKVQEQPVVVSASAPAVAAAASAPERPPQKNPGRCFVCNKKIGLTGFKCRCEYMFCASHRYPEKHECSFDFKTLERERLARANPLVQADKVERF